MVSGRGRINGGIQNDGLIVAESPDGSISLTDGLTQGPFGVLRAEPGGTLTLAEAFSGGELDLQPGSIIAYEGSSVTLDKLKLTGTMPVPPGKSLYVGPDVIMDSVQVEASNAGVVTSLLLTSGATIDGHINLNGTLGALIFTELGVAGGSGQTLGEHASVVGRGRISGALVNHGTLSPGNIEPAKAIGLFEIIAPHTLTSTAKINIQLVGPAPGQFDRLTGNTTLNLDGTLTIDYINGWVPQGNERLEIIKGSAINGEFAEIIFSEKLSPTGPEQVFYTGNSVIVVMCYADTTGDGTLTIDDFIAFQTNFAIGSKLADCDQDTLLSIDDFICFQTLFAIGC